MHENERHGMICDGNGLDLTILHRNCVIVAHNSTEYSVVGLFVIIALRMRYNLNTQNRSTISLMHTLLPAIVLCLLNLQNDRGESAIGRQNGSNNQNSGVAHGNKAEQSPTDASQNSRQHSTCMQM